MTRARIVAGPAAHRHRVAEALRAALLRPVPAEVVLADAVAMKARLLRDLAPDGPWDIKAMPGGLTEVEFIAQALQLVHGRAHPAVLQTTTHEALAALGRAGLLPEAERLIAIEGLWRSLLSVLRLSVGRGRELAVPGPTATALLRAAAPYLPRAAAPDLPVAAAPDLPVAAVDQAGLRTQMAQAQAAVRAAFTRHIGPLPETTGRAATGTGP